METINGKRQTDNEMTVSVKGYCLIARFESLKFNAYKCPAGVWTIGYGHTKGVKKGDIINYKEASDLLKEDCEICAKAVRKCGNLSQNQFDALVSFTFNVGTAAFNNSTLKKKVVRNNTDPSIKDEFMKWVYAGGKKLQGLINRRNEEAKLYFKID